MYFYVDSIDEDFALSVINVITTLTLRLPNELRLQLYTRIHATKLGQGIFVCVQLARKERYKALRLKKYLCYLLYNLKIFFFVFSCMYIFITD